MTRARFGQMKTPKGSHAIVREVPNAFERALRSKEPETPIDVARARAQHERYCEALQTLGLTLLRLSADERFPDCPFVEDTAVVLGEGAIIANLGAPSRRGEEQAVAEALAEYMELYEIVEPARLDGGDVLSIARTLFVGLSGRTNRAAAEQLDALLRSDGYEVVAVSVREVLHLKSACTYLGGDILVHLPGHLDDEAFSKFERIIVPPQEAPAANCLAVNGRVLVPAGAPRTRAHIEAAGFEVLELDISEAAKAGGGLTCSSIIF